MSGYIGLLMLLVTLALIGLMFIIMNPFETGEENEIPEPITSENIEEVDPLTITNPVRLQQTQDVVDNFQQKSKERQTIDFDF